MYVCVCHAVTEKHVDEAISRGCRSVRDLGELLGVGRTCGRCSSCAHEIIREACCAECPTEPTNFPSIA